VTRLKPRVSRLVVRAKTEERTASTYPYAPPRNRHGTRRVSCRFRANTEAETARNGMPVSGLVPVLGPSDRVARSTVRRSMLSRTISSTANARQPLQIGGARRSTDHDPAHESEAKRDAHPPHHAGSSSYAWMTENRGVPSSSLGLAIEEGPRHRRGPSSRGRRRGFCREIHPVRDPSGALAVWALMRAARPIHDGPGASPRDSGVWQTPERSDSRTATPVGGRADCS